MIWTYRGQPIPLEVYHGVPKGWYAADVVAAHAALGGSFALQGQEATEPGAPPWLPERHAWLQYRATLYRLAEGVRAGDGACAELAIRYIELHHIGSYSGYARARLARSLKWARLNEPQRQRLHAHSSALVTSDVRTHEFAEYARLWRRIIRADERADLAQRLTQRADAEARLHWLSHALDPVDWGRARATRKATGR